MRKTGLAGAALAPLRDFASCRCRVDFIDRSTVFGQSGYPGISCVRRLFLPIPKVERPALKRSGRTMHYPSPGPVYFWRFANSPTLLPPRAPRARLRVMSSPEIIAAGCLVA